MESGSITEMMAVLALQLGVILFAVKIFGKLAKKVKIPQVLGELIAGVVIGPFALGGIPLPGFQHGLFTAGSGSLAVTPELYAFASIASIMLLFVSGLETDIGLFLRYSLAGGVIGIGGVLVSFSAGALTGVLLFDKSFMDPLCLFLGILSTATSVGITARILSEHKKMDSPEGVTILAAAVFDDVLGIIALAIVLGIVAISGNADNAVQGTNALQGTVSSGVQAKAILVIAGKALGIWLGFTVLGLVFSKRLARFLKMFKHGFDFSILALGIALILAGVFEKHGLAMIIGAYIAGLSLSKTDIAAVIQERIRGIYEFFVPVFFAVMGMMVNVKEIISPQALMFGAVYTGVAVLSKIAGCGGPAMLMGFNARGALRIGAGMVPRGEVALIIAGIGLASGILDQQIFAAVILMTLITTLAAPPLLSATLKIAGAGTRRPVKGDDSVLLKWEFSSAGIADVVINTLLNDLRAEGFYVQMMSLDEGLLQARKDDIVLSIDETDNFISIETARADMPFVKTLVYEVIVELHDSIQKLKDSSDPKAMKKELLNKDGRTNEELLALVCPECTSVELNGRTKQEIITELVDLLASRHKLLDRDLVLADVLDRERTMSTGMAHGIALPHGKTEGVDEMVVAVGVKKAGIDFESLDGEKSRLFIMVASPKKYTGPHLQFLAAIGSILEDTATCEAVINSATPEEAAKILRKI